MPQFTLTFSSSSPEYQVLDGTVITSGGNPGACLDGGIAGTGFRSIAKVRVNLPAISTVLPLKWGVYGCRASQDRATTGKQCIRSHRYSLTEISITRRS